MNPSLGRIDLTVVKSFPLDRYVTLMERFGYVLGPKGEDPPPHRADALVRMGVCIAIAMNSMILGSQSTRGLTTPCCSGSSNC